jgi:hypothetical protein
MPDGGLRRRSGQKASGCHGDDGGCSVSVDFARTKDGREKGNSTAFCGRGSLMEKEMRGRSGWPWMREGGSDWHEGRRGLAGAAVGGVPCRNRGGAGASTWDAVGEGAGSFAMGSV